jgi:hypothetical protein
MDRAEPLIRVVQDANPCSIATKEYVRQKISQQTWHLVLSMAAQAALIVALLK